MNSSFHYVIIGGGLGGLATAALLAHHGKQVALLEAHSSLGGCAGFFDRYQKLPDGTRSRFRFDVGATTVSGIQPHQPLGRLFAELNARPQLRNIDPGMVCHLSDGTRVTRYADHHKWIAECRRIFGEQNDERNGQRAFWQKVFTTEEQAWKLSAVNPTFPPKSLGDLVRMATLTNLRYLPLLRHTWTSVAEVLKEYGLEKNEQFLRFINEQLMITAQNRADETPFLIGSMGLGYPSETWYADGGMYALAEVLAQTIIANNGVVKLKRKVTGIKKEGDRWRIMTARGEEYYAKTVISNATLYDMISLTSGQIQQQVTKLQPIMGWGAFTLYCAVRDDFEDFGTPYHQIHCQPLPESGAESIFVSLSHPSDHLRAPKGWRTVTVSTHVAQPWRWERPTPSDPSTSTSSYRDAKDLVEQAVLCLMEQVLPGFATAERRFVLTGTPATFQRYTHRLHGMVGGVPHSINRNVLFAQKHRTGIEGLYLVGDTVYPGQGAPGVVLGALNLVDELIN